MKQSFFLGAYWDARRESVDDCTASMCQFLTDMAAIDPALSHWYELGRSRKDALARPVDHLDPSRLQALLRKGRNRYDEGGSIIEDLGFNTWLWNGAGSDEGEASLSVHCGSFSKRVGNSIALDLPTESDNLSDVNFASSLLALVARTWRPRWAGIMSKRSMRERGFDADQPFVDWMVYVPRVIQSAPPSSTVVPVVGLGSIVIVQAEQPKGNNPQELQRIHQVEAALAA